jgi:hypothetical protein
MKQQRTRKDQIKRTGKEQEKYIELGKPEEDATIFVEARRNGLKKQRRKYCK